MSHEAVLVKAIGHAFRSGGHVLICGNGGLAAVAEHFAAELMGKFVSDLYIPCTALSTNTSLMTALANDMGFEELFAHQVKVLGRPGDVLIAMTTTKSPNIVRAIEEGNRIGMVTFALCAPSSPHLGAKRTHRMRCEDRVDVVQDAIMRSLHRVARKLKKGGI